MLQDTQGRVLPAASDVVLQAEPPPSPVSGPVYRFENIEVNSSQGCLKRDGHDQYVRQQSFQVLLYLLEQRRRLVSKEELVQNFWRDTAVTDNALVQCIADIRKVLGDDSRNPRFVKTIPKVGYRFIGAVEVDAPEPTPRKAGVETITPLVGKEAKWPGKRMFAGVAALAAILAGTFVIIHTSRTRQLEVTLPPIPGKKPVAVMYFENQSKRADVNWLSEGLADMFIADLTHSDQLTVLSRQQLELLLKRIGHKPGSEIDLDEALEIARRSHAEAVVLGSFAPLGEGFLITVQLYEAGHGRLLAADRLAVGRPAEILGQVDLLSSRLASRLGVAASSGAKKATLAEAMTRNFEAYRYYSLGVSKAQSFENTEAVALLQKAIQLDPKFAMAYARIGYAYSVTDFMPDKGRPYLEKAFRLSNRLTEKDRLYVMAWYAIAREDYPSAIRTLQQILSEYPLEIEAYSRLGRLLYREERSQEAISVLQQGLAKDPDAGDLYNALGICFLGLGQYDDAIAAHERYVELSPKEPNAHDSLGMSYQQSGRYEEAMAEYETSLSLDPEFEPAIIHMGDVYSQQGRYRDAIRQYERYIQVTRSDAARGVGYGSIAQVYRRKGDLRLGEQAARDEMRYEPGAIWNSLLFALDRGDKAKAASLQQRLFENLANPERGARRELRSYDYHLGTLALRNKRPDEAIAHFKEALHHLPPSSGLDLYEDCLGNAYLELGRLDQAIGEYQRILRLNPNYPLLEYHFGEAYEGKGEREQARIAYTRFLKIWKNGDSDTPEIIDARKRLSALSAANRRPSKD